MKTNFLGNDILNDTKQEQQNWLVKINISNHPEPYHYMIENIHFWLCDDDYSLVRQIQLYCEPYFSDTIEWEFVSVEDLREWLQDEKEEIDNDGK